MGLSRMESAKCAPPPNKTYLTVGQDMFAIEGYMREQYNYSLHEYLHHQQHHQHKKNGTTAATSSTRHKRQHGIPRLKDTIPAAFMVYTDIQTLRGLDSPTDYGSGIEYASGILLDQSTTAVGLQIGLWLNGTDGCRDIVEGRLDENVKALVRYLKHCRAQTVFLRVGYEFDNPGFRYAANPALFQEAYRVLVDACRKDPVCRDKTVMVWHSWAAGLPGNTTLQAFYPGDEYVDWIGVSLFNQFYTNVTGGGTLQTVQQVLDFAKQRGKPTMIAESTPFGGIDALQDPWNDWFQMTIDLIDEYDISMWSYINCDWDTQPMWRNVGFGDTRLSTNATVMKEWNRRVLQNPRFLQGGSLCQADASRHADGVLGMSLDAAGASHESMVTGVYAIGAAFLVAMAALAYRRYKAAITTARDAGTRYAAVPDDDDDHDKGSEERTRTGYGTL